jgi:hypothetical protein
VRPRVLDMGLASTAELDELDTPARAHLQDSHTVVTGHDRRSGAGASGRLGHMHRLSACT